MSWILLLVLRRSKIPRAFKVYVSNKYFFVDPLQNCLSIIFIPTFIIRDSRVLHWDCSIDKSVPKVMTIDLLYWDVDIAFIAYFLIWLVSTFSMCMLLLTLYYILKYILLSFGSMEYSSVVLIRCFTFPGFRMGSQICLSWTARSERPLCIQNGMLA